MTGLLEKTYKDCCISLSLEGLFAKGAIEV